MAGILRVRDGVQLYLDFDVYPYVLTYYPPIMYFIAGLTSRWFQLDIFGAVLLSRSIAFAMAIACSGLVYSLGRAMGARRQAALAGSLLLLPLPLFDPWGFSARVDTLAVAFGLLSALLLLRYPHRVWLAALCAVLAVFTKQTAIAFPVAASVWLLFQGRRAAALQFTVVYALVCGLLLASLQITTNGLYIQNVVLANINPTDDGLPVRRLLKLIKVCWMPAILAMLRVLSEARERSPSLVSLYSFVSFFIAFFTLRGGGSDVNHLLEAAALMCVLAAVQIDAIWRRSKQVALIGSIAILGASSLWAWQLLPYWLNGGTSIREAGSPLADYWKWGRGAVQGSSLPLDDIRKAERVLAEEPMMTLLADRPVVVSDTYHLSMMTSSGRWNPGGLVALLEEHQFDLVVMAGEAGARREWEAHQPLWPDQVREAVMENYDLSKRHGPFWLYVPKRPG